MRRGVLYVYLVFNNGPCIQMGRGVRDSLLFKCLVSFSYPGLLRHAGELDNLPEVAFYMVGPIAEVRKKAEALAKEQQGS